MPCTYLPAALAAVSLLGAHAVLAQSTMTPLATFGANGWLAPGTSAFLTTVNTERGLAYNPTTGNLVLVSRTGGSSLRVLNGQTGADLGGLVNTGIAGGTFAVNMTGIAEDGSIYVGNLSTSATANFKIYKWDSEALGLLNAPTVVYDALSGMVRTGDSFAITGGSGGNPIRFAAAGSSNANNSCFAVGPVDGSNASTAYLSIPGTPNGTANGYRLGLTFVDQGTVIGTQGVTGLLTSFSGSTATLQASIPLGIAQRAMDHAVIGGLPILAVIDSNSSIVSVYDIAVPTAPALLVSATATTGILVGNSNGTGSVQWGAISGNTATLYAMNTNQGIQAFQVTIQVPANARVFGSGCGSPALSLATANAPILPSTVNLDLTNLPATALAFYVLGFASIPGGLPLPIAPGCTQYVVPEATFLVIPTTPGSAQFALGVPSNAAFAGLAVFAQGLSLDPPFAIQSSNAMRLYLETF
jgi:hypothetical protein